MKNKVFIRPYFFEINRVSDYIKYILYEKQVTKNNKGTIREKVNFI